MGRAGVTLLDVEKAALQLQGRGKNPSVDAIRELLGTGSKSTITQHLRDWKSVQQEAQGKLPNELLALVTGLWERLNNQADQRVTEIENNHTQQEQAIKQTLFQTQKELEQLKKHNHHHEEALAESSAKNKTIENNRLALQQELAQLTERHHVTVQQLDENKKENTRLHQLANNIQSNLEHYQNSMQQLRTEQQLVNEKQQAQYQQQIQLLQQELQHARQQVQNFEGQAQQFKAQHNDLFAAQTELKQQNQQQTRDVALLTEQKQTAEQKIQVYKKELSEKSTSIIDTEKQLALFMEKSKTLEKTLQEAEDKIEALRQEKLFLTQEKAELHGALKQLEKIL